MAKGGELNQHNNMLICKYIINTNIIYSFDLFRPILAESKINSEIHVGASIGIALFPENGMTVD